MKLSRYVGALCASVTIVACGDDEGNIMTGMDAATPVMDAQVSSTPDTTHTDAEGTTGPAGTSVMPDAGGGMTLCQKYGGADVVKSVVQNQVIGAIAEDCRINTFFTSLDEASFTRVGDCLTTQVQELFGCEGIMYQGAEASNGLRCRSMAEAHEGLDISKGDFDALIEDVVAGLTAAGVAPEDIAAAAPALLGMEPDIIESDSVEYTQLACLMADDGGTDAGDDTTMDGGHDGSTEMDASPPTEPTLCDKYGGPDNVASVVQTNVIGAIVEDCRINTFFTSLDADSLTRVNDCLTIQVQGLFGCVGYDYANSQASNGLTCRSMADAHAGLGISQGDFDALIEDVVAGMTEAGIESQDIAAAAPALLGMQPDIVENDDAMATKAMCELADGGAP